MQTDETTNEAPETDAAGTNHDPDSDSDVTGVDKVSNGLTGSKRGRVLTEADRRKSAESIKRKAIEREKFLQEVIIPGGYKTPESRYTIDKIIRGEMRLEDLGRVGDDTSTTSDEESEEEIDNAASPQRPAAPAVKKKETKPVARGDKTVPPLEGFPRDEIAALEQEGFTEILMHFSRKLPGAGLANMKSNIRMPTRGLSEMMPAIYQFCGGGNFLFSLSDPETRMTIGPKWRDTIEGPVRLPPHNTHTLAWSEERSRLEVIAITDTMGTNVGVTGFAGLSGGLTGVGPQAMPGMPGPGGMGMGVGTGGPGPMQPQHSTAELYAIAARQNPSPQRDSAGNLLPPPPGHLPQWTQAFPADQQWNLILAERVRQLEQNQQQNGAAAAPLGQWVNHEIQRGHDVAVQAASLQTELRNMQATLQSKIESVQKEAQAQVEREREARARAERELERTRGEAETKALSARLDALMAAPKGPDWGTILTGLAGLVPVATAYMQMKGESERQERDAQMKVLLATLTKKDDGGGFEKTLAAVTPLAVPILTKWMESSGPQAQAEVLAIEHEQRMMMIKMMADMVSSMTPDTPQAEWWRPLLEMLGKGMTTISQRVAMQQLPKPQPQNALPPSSDAPAAERAQQSIPLLDQMAAQDPEAANAVRLVYSQLSPDLGFHTQEWMTILFNVHAKQMPEELAPVIAAHIFNCDNFSMLPRPLAEILSSPREAITGLFNFLPVSQNDPAYVAELTDRLVQIIEEETEDDEEAEAEPETEAQAQDNATRNQAAGIAEGHGTTVISNAPLAKPKNKGGRPPKRIVAPPVEPATGTDAE